MFLFQPCVNLYEPRGNCRLQSFILNSASMFIHDRKSIFNKSYYYNYFLQFFGPFDSLSISKENISVFIPWRNAVERKPVAVNSNVLTDRGIGLLLSHLRVTGWIYALEVRGNYVSLYDKFNYLQNGLHDASNVDKDLQPVGPVSQSEHWVETTI